jgi:hypothetical protein
MSDENILVRKDLLQIVFDAAVSSMDFTSGFLDDEEVSALRDIAVLLGVEPAVATPKEFKGKYEGAVCKREGHIRTGKNPDTCSRCLELFWLCEIDGHLPSDQPEHLTANGCYTVCLRPGCGCRVLSKNAHVGRRA